MEKAELIANLEQKDVPFVDLEGLNSPSVVDFPACINCIFSFDSGEDCRRHPISHDCSLPCGDGMFVVDTPTGRDCVSYERWIREALREEDEKARKEKAA